MGIFGVASLLLTAVEQFSATGFPQSLIQKQGDIQSYIQPVRTFQAIRGLILGLIIFLSASWMSVYFNSPSSLGIIRVIAIIPVINGLEPLFLILAQKNLKFKRLVVLQIFASFVGLFVGIFVAYIHPDAWSLVWASLSVALIITIGGHVLSPRHNIGFTLKLNPLKELASFGLWMLGISILAYFITKGADWIIGRNLSVEALAYYQMAYLVCTMVTGELGGVISKLTFPVYSQLQDDKKMIQAAFKKSFGFIAIITVGIAGLLVVSAPDLILLTLGNSWENTITLIPWLSIWGVTIMFAGPQSSIFKAKNKLNIWAMTLLIMAILIAFGLPTAISTYGIEGAAIYLAMVGIIIQLFRYYLIGKILEMEYLTVFKHVAIPLSVTIISSFIAIAGRGVLNSGAHYWGILVSIVTYISAYIMLIVIVQKWLEPSLDEIRKRFGIVIGSIFKY